jgi:hypothetical protein
MYVSMIVLYAGFYISLVQFELFACLLWVFESAIIFYLFLITVVFKNYTNLNQWNYYDLFLLVIVLLMSIFYVYCLQNILFINVYNYLYYYYIDVYICHLSTINDFFLLFILYYYIFTYLIILILMCILILTYFIISFYKILNSQLFLKNLYHLKYSLKFYKRQYLPSQLALTNNLIFFKRR